MNINLNFKIKLVTLILLTSISLNANSQIISDKVMQSIVLCTSLTRETMMNVTEEPIDVERLLNKQSKSVTKSEIGTTYLGDFRTLGTSFESTLLFGGQGGGGFMSYTKKTEATDLVNQIQQQGYTFERKKIFVNPFNPAIEAMVSEVNSPYQKLTIAVKNGKFDFIKDREGEKTEGLIGSTIFCAVSPPDEPTKK